MTWLDRFLYGKTQPVSDPDRDRRIRALETELAGFQTAYHQLGRRHSDACAILVRQKAQISQLEHDLWNAQQAAQFALDLMRTEVQP